MTQKEVVLKHLKRHGAITSWDAIWEHGITRLSEYIRQLREEGYEIESEWISKKKGESTVRFVKYKMKK